MQHLQFFRQIITQRSGQFYECSLSARSDVVANGVRICRIVATIWIVR